MLFVYCVVICLLVACLLMACAADLPVLLCLRYPPFPVFFGNCVQLDMI